MAVRASQDVIAALSLSDLAYTQASQVVINAFVLVPGSVAPAHATTIDLEGLVGYSARTRATWILLEVLVWRGGPLLNEATMPAIYPTLPGLAFSVIKRPKFFTGIGTSASGREVRVGYAQNPLWEWDLTYEWLPDKAEAAAATPSDLKQLVGFYLSQAGALGGFLFLDPDDNAVTGQVIATTDGVTTNYTLVRTYGGSDGTGTEPIGYLSSGSLSAYLDGVLVDPATYDLLSTQPVVQVIKFHTAPAAGKVLTVNMTFYYYVRFKDDHYDFEKFMDKLWSQRLITLMSLRG